MCVYLDNASTTKPSKAVVDGVVRVLEENYGNPSSLHMLGVRAEKEINTAKKIVADCLNVTNSVGEIIFTSGGTESNALAIQGIAKRYKRRGNSIITVKNEHPSVLENFKALQDQGYNVKYLETDEQGLISLEQLEEAITEETTLVSIMHVHNETGVIQDIAQISECIKRKNTQTKFHVDAVQSFGKLDINIKYVDAMTISAHKIHGVKGSGGLYIKKGVLISPLLYGGDQQKSIRSGTENVAGIVSLGIATQEMYGQAQKNLQHAHHLRKTLLRVIEEMQGVTLNGSVQHFSPYIVNLKFSGIRGEVLLHALESRGIYVSTGSACSAKKNLAHENVRFSFSKYNTVEEVEFCINNLKECAVQLKKSIC